MEALSAQYRSMNWICKRFANSMYMSNIHALNKNNNKMKTVVLLGDGMGDFPVEELGDRTLADGAGADDAQNSGCMVNLRMVNTVPEGLPRVVMWQTWRF